MSNFRKMLIEFTIKYKKKYSDEIQVKKFDNRTNAYIFFNDLCKDSSTEKAKIFRHDILISEYEKK